MDLCFVFAIKYRIELKAYTFMKFNTKENKQGYTAITSNNNK